MVLHLLLPGIHAQLVNCLQSYTGKSLPLAHEEFLLSLECFLAAALLYCFAAAVGSIEKRLVMPKQKSKILNTMEQHSFSLGRPRQETKTQKKERLQRKKEEKRKELLRKQKRQQDYVPLPHRPKWLLLPPHVTKGFEFWIMTMKGDTFLEKKATLTNDIQKWKEPIQSTFGFDTSRTIHLHKDYVEKAKVVLSLLYQNQAIRWRFKRFFTKLRIQRFKQCNEVDPITMESIREPIRFPSFSQRKLYVFEAKPFAKHLHNKLVQNDGHIPDPQLMKNPLTNEFFTVSQIISLIEQVKRFGYSSWAIEAFRACRYDLSSFSLINSKPLRLHAVRNVMAKVDDWDCIDTVYDFIKSQHALHDEVFRVDIYKWAVNRAPHESRIESWRKMCLKWYEVDILIEDPDLKHRMFRKIEEKTLLLCTRPNELSALRRQKTKSSASTDGSSSL